MPFISRSARLIISAALLAATAACARPQAGFAGQWQLSWQGRIGTEQAMLLLQPAGEVLGGSFRNERGSVPLSGSVHASKLSFAVDFPGPPAYRIVFSGVVQGNQIQGDAQPLDVNGRAFAGHGGEIARDYYAWTATRVPQ
jgi:hypothetical protein